MNVNIRKLLIVPKQQIWLQRYLHSLGLLAIEFIFFPEIESELADFFGRLGVPTSIRDKQFICT